ncbi:hypothetical protein [Tateyamaria sp. SN6-1]|uniref:hypothetical protein n=1 Tax=Tateyamaria sp. SN6-1 TaxID=3092148 RepID=UPI0039F4F08F
MHNKFTIVVPILPGQQGAVRAMLEPVGTLCPDTSGDPFGFAQIETLHFASLCLFDDTEDGWSLLFEHNIDGTIETHIDNVLAVAETLDGGAFLLSLCGHCAGFSGDTLGALRAFLLEHVIKPQAGFISAVGMSRDQIRLDARVYDVVDAALGPAGEPLSPAEAQDRVIAALDADPSVADWQSFPDPGTALGLMGKIAAVISLIANAIAFAVLAIVNLPRERAADEERARPDPDLQMSLAREEDLIPTNHMLSVVYVHTDAGRQLAKRAAFGLLRNLVTLVFRKGFLGEIDTIHFAHWSFCNDNRRLIFVSNYDGSWRSYLDDFTLKASNGLNLAWAHSVGYPKTWAMLKGGASNGPQFIDYARRSMYPTLVWYSAYPSVSATNIDRNRQLRAALIKARQGSTDTSWLELV